MSNECSNQLVVVGPLKSLARFKRQACNFKSHDDQEVELCMNIQAPYFSSYDIDRLNPVRDCDMICDASLKYIDSETGYGCLDFGFSTPWDPPLEFVREASTLFPFLEFHLTYMEEGVGFAGKVTYLDGKPNNEFHLKYIVPDDCLKEFLNRPRPDPLKDGLFEFPDSLKPNQSEGDSQCLQPLMAVSLGPRKASA